MLIEVKTSGDKDKPWGLYINGVLFGASKNRFDADFGMHFLEDILKAEAVQNFNIRQWVVQCWACGWLQIRNDFDWGPVCQTYVDDPKKLKCPRCGDEYGVIIGGLGDAK